MRVSSIVLPLLVVTTMPARAQAQRAEPAVEYAAQVAKYLTDYAGHSITVKAVLKEGGAGGDVFPAFVDTGGKAEFNAALKLGVVTQVKIISAQNLRRIKFFAGDKRTEIVAKITARETSPGRREVRRNAGTVRGSQGQIIGFNDLIIEHSPEAEFIFEVTSAGGSSADSEMIRLMNIEENDVVEIAAAVASRQKASGNWFPVRRGKLFSTIEFLTGVIDGCRSKPDKIAQQRKPEAHFIDGSEVLNANATRVTLAYFIRIKRTGEEARTNAYFSLLSYDLGGGETPICATEFFLFGPFAYERDGVTPTAKKPRLLAGLAIGADATLIPAVPLALAKVRNYVSDAPPDEPVRPGVSTNGQGCRKCHGRRDGIPDATGPFPWGDE